MTDQPTDAPQRPAAPVGDEPEGHDATTCDVCTTDMAVDEAIENTPEQVRAWTLGYLAGKHSAAPVAVDEATMTRVLDGLRRGRTLVASRRIPAGSQADEATAREVVRALAARDDDHGTTTSQL